jgi:HSP20 family molecular chaperone IbpA
MKENHLVKWLFGIIAVCVILLAILGYHNYKLVKEIEQRKAFEDIPPLAALHDPWLEPWDPTGDFARVHAQMDKMMQQMMPGSMFSQRGFGFATAMPKINLKEFADRYEVTVDMPKGQQVDLSAQLTDGVLNISGKVKNEQRTEKDQQYSEMFSTSQFSQSVTFDHPIDESGMKVKREQQNMLIIVPKK